MARNFFTGLNSSNFKKLKGCVEIYLIVNPSTFYKTFLPIQSTEPLMPVVLDNTSSRYVLYGQSVQLIKRFPFIPSLFIDDLEHTFPFPKQFILSKLTKKEKKIMEDMIASGDDYTFFQVMQR